MKHRIDARVVVLRCCLAILVAGAALFASPGLVRLAFAQDDKPTCTVTCGSQSCTGNQSYCTCSCHWLTNSPVCKCTAAPAEPVDQTSVS